MVLSRDLARFGLFGEAEIWSHDSLPNLICKNLEIFNFLKVQNWFSGLTWVSLRTYHAFVCEC